MAPADPTPSPEPPDPATDPAPTAQPEDFGGKARLVGVLLAAVSGLFLIVPVGLLARGLVVAGTVGLLVVGAAAIFGLLVALSPPSARRILRFFGAPPTGGGAMGACVVVFAVLVLIGSTLVFGVQNLELAVRPGLAPDPVQGPDAAGAQPSPIGLETLVISVVLTLVLMAGSALAYLRLAHGKGPREALASMQLRGGPKEVVVGLGWAGAFLAAVFVLSLALVWLGVGEDTGLVQDLVGGLTWPAALALFAGGAFGEEVFFRGFLQPRIGLVPQAIWFSLAHAGYLSVHALLGTLVGGLLLGYAYKRSDNLLVPMVGHGAYNVAVFALAGAA